MKFVRILLLVAVVGLSPASGPAQDTSLSELIVERLSLMRPVAAWKLAHNYPVEDLEREADVLRAAQEAASEQGIDPVSVAGFFQAQMDAAKDIQYCWIRQWDKVTASLPEHPPDLVAEIRPELLRLGDAIVAKLDAELRHGAHVTVATVSLDLECLSPQSAAAIVTALGEVRLTSP